jgi:hypothetical protein
LNSPKTCTELETMRAEICLLLPVEFLADVAGPTRQTGFTITSCIYFPRLLTITASALPFLLLLRILAREILAVTFFTVSFVSTLGSLQRLMSGQTPSSRRDMFLAALSALNCFNV